MRRPLTISQILASLPAPPFWRALPGGRPRNLTIAGKGAVSILESHGFDTARILSILDLRMTPAEFEAFKQISAITDEDVHRRNKERLEVERAGRWQPSWTGRASSR
jgi:hypothetical protein